MMRRLQYQTHQWEATKTERRSLWLTTWHTPMHQRLFARLRTVIPRASSNWTIRSQLEVARGESYRESSTQTTVDMRAVHISLLFAYLSIAYRRYSVHPSRVNTPHLLHTYSALTTDRELGLPAPMPQDIRVTRSQFVLLAIYIHRVFRLSIPCRTAEWAVSTPLPSGKHRILIFYPQPKVYGNVSL